MKKYLTFFSSLMLVGMFVIVPVFVGAQDGPVGGGTGDTSGPVGGGTGDTGSGSSNFKVTFDNPLSVSGVKDISGLIQLILEKIVIPIGAVVSVLFIIYAGFMYVSARGNPEAISKAHQALLNAVIGTLIILGSWAISLAIAETIDQIKSGL